MASSRQHPLASYIAVNVGNSAVFSHILTLGLTVIHVG